MGETILILGILALTIPIPLLIILHYTSRWKRSRELSGADEKMLEELWQTAQTMTARVATLETILDETESDWRKSL